MTQQDSENSSVLYKDPNVQITDKSVKVHKFYFPQDSSNEIPFSDINKLALKDMDEMDETLGAPASFFKDFSKRVEEKKNMYIEMGIQNGSICLSFVPDDAAKVLKLIQEKCEQFKKQTAKDNDQPLQQTSLYTNVEVTAEKIQQAMEHLKKSEQNNAKDGQNEIKRTIQQVSSKTKELEQGENPKKKVKEDDRREVVNEQNRNPNIEVE